jgi:signal transduction histidine kinase
MRSLFGFGSRRAFRVLQLGAQIRLPLYLLLITVTFVSLFSWHTHSAYAKLYAMVMTSAPESYQEQILSQTQDLSIVGAAILGAFVLAMVGFCVAYTHTLLGPTIPLRHHVKSMKDGNYQARNTLRKSDTAHQGLADDLNELASVLQNTQKNARSAQGAERSA